MWYRYYNIDIYHRRKTTKQRLKGMKDMLAKKTERTEFNDEEQRRYVLIHLCKGKLEECACWNSIHAPHFFFTLM